MIIFLWVVIGFAVATIIGKKTDNDWLWIGIWAAIFIVSLIISFNVTEQNKQKELDNCPKVINPYQVWSFAYDWFEFATNSNSSRECPNDDYWFFYENYCPDVREYSNEYYICVETLNTYFNEWCEEYFSLKDYRKQCLDEVEKKYSDY